PPPATHTLSLHDALPISCGEERVGRLPTSNGARAVGQSGQEVVEEPPGHAPPVVEPAGPRLALPRLAGRSVREACASALETTLPDRKSTRLNSSHVKISY